MSTLHGIDDLPTFYKGLKIDKICDCLYVDDKHNHCAHFVSHVLGYKFGFKCKDMTGKGTGIGANIRVHEIFAKCPQLGLWSDPTRPSGNCLAFVTKSSCVNLVTKVMLNIPSKHIGIFYKDKIYHYSNRKDQVVAQTVQEFSTHYPGSDIAVYYGTFPSI